MTKETQNTTIPCGRNQNSDLLQPIIFKMSTLEQKHFKTCEEIGNRDLHYGKKQSIEPFSEGVQMLDLKSAIINTFKELKDTMFEKLKASMTTVTQEHKVLMKRRKSETTQRSSGLGSPPCSLGSQVPRVSSS